MKIKEVMEIINKPNGFMVSFEWIEGSILRSDHFPEKHTGEQLIATEEEAWELARKFAGKTKGHTANIYVIDSNFGPVFGYSAKTIKNK